VTAPPKYALAEIERRWLVDLAGVGPLEGRPYHDIEDLYLNDSRLRLRKIRDTQEGVVFKFCKKYGKSSGYSEPITNLYLTEGEHRALSGLGGKAVRKRRYAIGGGALDLYGEGSEALAVFEVQFASEDEAGRYEPPPFVREEVTHEESYSGAALARRGA
jgi:CYTH domain-containing protein